MARCSMTNAQRLAYLEEKQLFQDWTYFLGVHLGNDKVKMLMNSFLDWRPSMRSKVGFAFGINEPIVVRTRFCRKTCSRSNRDSTGVANEGMYCKLASYSNKSLNIPPTHLEEMSQTFDLSPEQARHEMKEEKSRRNSIQESGRNESVEKSSIQNEVADGLRENLAIVNKSVVKTLNEKSCTEIRLRIQLLLANNKVTAGDRCLKTAADNSLKTMPQIVELESRIAQLELDKCELTHQLRDSEQKVPDMKDFLQSYATSTNNKMTEERLLRTQIENKVTKLERERNEMFEMTLRLRGQIVNIGSSLVLYKNAAEKMLDMDYSTNKELSSQVELLLEASRTESSEGCLKEPNLDNNTKESAVMIDSEEDANRQNRASDVETELPHKPSRKSIELSETSGVIRALRKKVKDIESSLASKTDEMQLYQLAAENLLTTLSEEPLSNSAIIQENEYELTTPEVIIQRAKTAEKMDQTTRVDNETSISIEVTEDLLRKVSDAEAEAQWLNEKQRVEGELYKNSEDLRISLQGDMAKLQSSLDAKIEELKLYQLTAENIFKSNAEEISAEKAKGEGRAEELQKQEVRIAALAGEVIVARSRLEEKHVELKLYQYTAEMLLDRENTPVLTPCIGSIKAPKASCAGTCDNGIKSVTKKRRKESGSNTTGTGLTKAKPKGTPNKRKRKRSE